MIFAVDQGLARLDGVAEDRRHRDALALELYLSVADARRVHQVVDEADHVGELASHHLAGALRGRSGGRQPQHFEAAAEGSERIAQLVGEGRQEFVFPAVRFAELVLAIA